jgi:hypothetical protein
LPPTAPNFSVIILVGLIGLHGLNPFPLAADQPSEEAVYYVSHPGAFAVSLGLQSAAWHERYYR